MSYGLLLMLQLSDSAFPTGAFAHSLGFEACREAGELEDEEDLRRILLTHLSCLSTSDCVAHREAYNADNLNELFRLDSLLGATKFTRETREASASTGRRFLAGVVALGVDSELLSEFHRAARSGETPGHLAVGHGLVAREMGLPAEYALEAYLYSSVASLVAAGQKLIPLGGGAAQRVLFGLREEIVSAARRGACLKPEEMYSFAPLLDVRSMQHEVQRTRLYIS